MDHLDTEPDLIDGKFMGEISADFVKVADLLKEASYQIRNRNISLFPIFPIAKVDIKIGKLLYGKFEFQTEWNYYISSEEEFMQLSLITEQSKFEETYKNPDEYCCLFVVYEDFVNFVFVPYPED
ncbi:MAG: hypothetical protein SFY32_01330 [Bacteroidota bacterium]|nr:hypothetical protein [Bacteroidota bacterium]